MSQPTKVTYSTKEDKGVCVVNVKGKLYSEEVLSFNDFALKIENPRIIMDLSEIDFICSGGLGTIMRLCQICKTGGGNIVILNPTDFVMKTLEITKIIQILKIANSYEEAMEFLTQNS